MKLQPESKKELTRIACGTAICTAVMWVIFAALHLVGWVKFDYTVVLGSLIGAAVAIGNFAGICIVCQKVIDEQDEKRRKATLQASYNVKQRHDDPGTDEGLGDLEIAQQGDVRMDGIQDLCAVQFHLLRFTPFFIGCGLLRVGRKGQAPPDRL